MSQMNKPAARIHIFSSVTRVLSGDRRGERQRWLILSWR